jgi:hypothetical protein
MELLYLSYFLKYKCTIDSPGVSSLVSVFSTTGSQFSLWQILVLAIRVVNFDPVHACMRNAVELT